jgi:hypothetical protein
MEVTNGWWPAPDYGGPDARYRIIVLLHHRIKTSSHHSFMASPSSDEVMDAVEAYQTDHDEIDGDHEVQEAWHNEDQDSREQCDDRTNVGVAEMHQYLLCWQRLTRKPAAGSIDLEGGVSARAHGGRGRDPQPRIGIGMRIKCGPMQVPSRRNRCTRSSHDAQYSHHAQ